MAVFENLKASVSKTMRQASDSMKTMSDKSRLKKDISTMENELRNRFRDVGEKYFNDTKENPDPAFQEMFAAIAQLQESLSDRRRDLNLLDGNLPCTNCGAMVSTDSRFCPNCGAPAPVPPKAEPAPVPQAVCPFCGQILDHDAVFCASCGNKVAGNPSAPTAPAGSGISPFAQPPAAPAADVPAAPIVPVVPADNAPAAENLPVNEASVTDSADDTLDPSVVDIAPDEVTDVPNAPAQAFCPECGEALSPDAMFCASCGSRIPGID